MPLKTQIDDPPTLNLTSMIDVVFQLIVFFMVGTRFATPEHKLDVQVPTVKDVSGSKVSPAKHVVHIGREGAILLDQDRVTLDELGTRLAALRRSTRDLSVLVRGDGQVPLQIAANVLATCRKAGVTDLGISAKTETSPHMANGGETKPEAGIRR